MENGKYYRRNCRDIRQQATPYTLDFEDDAREEETMDAKQEGKLLPEVEKSGIKTETAKEQHEGSPTIRTRSGRVIRKPLRYRQD